jgi:hypothetical protein
MLLKGGSGPYFQEPLNEVIASSIMRRLGIAHAAYALVWDNDQPMSACEDFITPQTDLVSAWHIRETGKKPGHISEYQHFLERCGALGIPGARESLDRMLAVDYLIVNADRHYNNFGAVRNAETLEWLGLAPIFDCGTSLWYDAVVSAIRPRAEQKSKPFRSKHGEQIELVTDFSWLDFAALRGVDEEYSELLRQSLYIEDNRRSVLCYALRERVALLEQAALSHSASAEAREIVYRGGGFLSPPPRYIVLWFMVYIFFFRVPSIAAPHNAVTATVIHSAAPEPLSPVTGISPSGTQSDHKSTPLKARHNATCPAGRPPRQTPCTRRRQAVRVCPRR